MHHKLIIFFYLFAYLESVDYEKLIREWDDDGDLIEEEPKHLNTGDPKIGAPMGIVVETIPGFLFQSIEF